MPTPHQGEEKIPIQEQALQALTLQSLSCVVLFLTGLDPERLKER